MNSREAPKSEEEKEVCIGIRLWKVGLREDNLGTTERSQRPRSGFSPDFITYWLKYQ